MQYFLQPFSFLESSGVIPKCFEGRHVAIPATYAIVSKQCIIHNNDCSP